MSPLWRRKSNNALRQTLFKKSIQDGRLVKHNLQIAVYVEHIKMVTYEVTF